MSTRFRATAVLKRPLAVVMALSAASSVAIFACSEPSEAPRVELPVVVDASQVVPVTTDLGYEVELSSARIVMDDLLFTVAGEVHAASLWRPVSEFVVPTAYAHPGHYQGGEVSGELLGTFVVDWPAEHGRELGNRVIHEGRFLMYQMKE